jgi:hypothetical protein
MEFHKTKETSPMRCFFCFIEANRLIVNTNEVSFFIKY